MAPALPPDARAAVLAWYDAGGRALAFRSSRDPYAILVSEVMAQQTQVSRVVEAWPGFLARFPTADALAAATPAEVLRAWQGMGYDRRALNLRLAAQVIRDRHGGRVPDDIEALDRLPGVGPYTARAVAAIAFGRRVGAVDTNVRRVLTRMTAVDGLALEVALAAGRAGHLAHPLVVAVLTRRAGVIGHPARHAAPPFAISPFGVAQAGTVAVFEALEAHAGVPLADSGVAAPSLCAAARRT
jgi:endonuclease III